MYVRYRDKPIKTVGITGLRENFGRDDGIEGPYWGTSISTLQDFTHPQTRKLEFELYCTASEQTAPAHESTAE